MRRGDYPSDRARSDAVLSDVAWVLGKACGWRVVPASDFLDTKRATDLIADSKYHVAVRSRSYDDYFIRYGNEFTLRSRRENGTETELSKIRRGFGDFAFYGFCQGHEHRYWRLIDLTVLRGALDALGLDAFSVEKPNHDKTFFRAFDVRLFEKRGLSIVHKEGAC